MRTLLEDRYAPITSSVGYLEASVGDTATVLEAWRRSLYRDVQVRNVDAPFPSVLRHLEPLTLGARPRELLVSAGTWTAYFDCSLRGTDAISAVGELSKRLRCQGLVVELVPHTVGMPGVVQGRAGAIQFTLFGPVGAHFLNYVRSVSVAFEGGKWVFTTSGTEQAFEEPAAYRSHLIRDRLTPDMLDRYCRALGVNFFEAAAYGPNSVLLESRVELPPNGIAVSLTEAQALLGITGVARQ